jgi:hypothetical protein
MVLSSASLGLLTPCLRVTNRLVSIEVVDRRSERRISEGPNLGLRGADTEDNTVLSPFTVPPEPSPRMKTPIVPW